MSTTAPRRTLAFHLTLFFFICCAPFSAAQQSPTQTVPHFVPFAGTVLDSDGHPRSGTTGLTFALYKEQTGGAPLWIETQNVQLDAKGHYSVQLGITQSDGIPVDMFSSGDARWLGVQPDGLPEQPRIMLVSVPYAMKAADAETIGGLPASAFARAPQDAPTQQSAAASTPAPASKVAANPTVTGKGTVNYIPMWDKTNDILNSILFQKTSSIGIATTTPATTLDVNGKTSIRDTLTLYPKSTDPTLAISGTTFKVDHTGKVTFVSGQTFPGAGTITGVNTATGSGLQGGGTTGTLGLSLLKTCTSGQTLAWNGSAWACKTISGGGSGTVTSVALSAPSSDFTVGGSPVTSSGTLAMNWTVPPTTNNTPNSIVKRDGSGNFYGGIINAQSALNTKGPLGVSGISYLVGPVSVGSTFAPQATLNVNVGGTANADTLLVGNNTNRGAQLRDTGNGIDFESIGVPMCINCATAEPTYFGNLVGIGTSGPQALLNLNLGGAANNDSLLLGNNTSRGIQMRDNGTGVDLESIGVPLNINFVTQQPLFLNPNGGPVSIGDPLSQPDAALYVGAVQLGNAFTSAQFSNDVSIAGNLLVLGAKNFRIDHPLDPTNKYLLHASIESSEVLNQYSGNVVLDDKGEGRVEFPDWFAAINVDFRYQLTAIGAPAPNLHVAQEITDRSFSIAGGQPGMKVSWQVTARRYDPYMKAHPMVVEQEKPDRARGHYTIPELYGAPKEMGMSPAPSSRNPKR